MYAIRSYYGIVGDGRIVHARLVGALGGLALGHDAHALVGIPVKGVVERVRTKKELDRVAAPALRGRKRVHAGIVVGNVGEEVDVRAVGAGHEKAVGVFRVES